MLTGCEKTFFCTFRVCFYDAALSTDFTIGAFNRLASCYSKCIKCFFGYPKYSSVTNMLFELGLLSFYTVIHNSKVGFANRMSAHDKCCREMFSTVYLVVVICISVCLSVCMRSFIFFCVGLVYAP